MSVNYCTWRKDGPKTEGYSHELIPDVFIKHFKSETSTEDDMKCWPKSLDGSEMTTLQEMLENTAARLPNGNFMGTK